MDRGIYPVQPVRGSISVGGTHGGACGADPRGGTRGADRAIALFSKSRAAQGYRLHRSWNIHLANDLVGTKPTVPATLRGSGSLSANISRPDLRSKLLAIQPLLVYATSPSQDHRARAWQHLGTRSRECGPRARREPTFRCRCVQEWNRKVSVGAAKARLSTDPPAPAIHSKHRSAAHLSLLALAGRCY